MVNTARTVDAENCMILYITSDIFVFHLSKFLLPLDIERLGCVSNFWRCVVEEIERQRAKEACAIMAGGRAGKWRQSSFLRLRSTIMPRFSVLQSKFLGVYRKYNNIYLLGPSGDMVGIIDRHNVLHRAECAWAGLYDAILLVLDSLPPLVTLSMFCNHCPFCGNDHAAVCNCAVSWLSWFGKLLPKRIHINRASYTMSEDLSRFRDNHVFVDNCDNCNSYHES